MPDKLSPLERVLVVEDAPDWQRMIQAALGLHYAVSFASTLEEARKQVAKVRFNLLVLDVNLPDGDGFEFCREIRTSHEQMKMIPVIFLTSRSELEDKLMAFSLGGDDYVAKPFEGLELRARVEARLSRMRQRIQGAEALAMGVLRLELATLRAYIVDKVKKSELGLTPIEFKILYHLARNETQVVSREQLLSTIWGDATHVFDRATDKHVSSLRQKLGDYAGYIETVSGVGYRLVVKAIG
jgi:DNA-binding response OmpR family regulator